MAYQPPPGTSSLPPRPPASASSNGGRSGFKPAFPSSSSKPSGLSYSSAPSYNAAPSGYPGAGSYTAAPSYSSYPGAAAPTGSSMSAGRGFSSYPGASSAPAGQQTYSQPHTTYSASPQIKNPFPNPAHAPTIANASDYDPEMAAQIAQWQSAYSREPASYASGDKHGKAADSSRPDGGAGAASAATASHDYHHRHHSQQQQQQQSQHDTDKKKTVVRSGGGKKWTDDSLLEWDPAHLRLFVGNLAGETTDDSLLKAFSPWKSVQKAKVVRDKRTNKSKGYGFVSFSDADDFFNAAKTMNGQYIQSHPVIVKKANTEIKAVTAKDGSNGNNHRGRGGGKYNNKNHGGSHKNQAKTSGSGSGAGGAGEGGYEASLGPVAPAGIVKPGQKTKNGLRLLG